MSHTVKLFILLLFHLFPASSVYAHGGYHINCGSDKDQTIGSIKWVADGVFTDVGNTLRLKTPGIIPTLSTLRHFPDQLARKYCYEIPVIKGANYLIRATYFYGRFDGGRTPPVFDQIVGGTRWSVVNTSENHANGLASYYEIVMAATGKKMSVCLARNAHTIGNPFISALELEKLEGSVYKTTDFKEFALATVARHRFGYSGPIMSYPDDPLNRYWEPFPGQNPAVKARSNVTSSSFWNLPAPEVFQSALTTSRGKTLAINWPTMQLPAANYYVALYFQDNRSPSPLSWRVFDVSINGNTFYSSLNVSTAGVMVYSSQWPLSGQTVIQLRSASGSPVGPVINAAELLEFVRMGGRTSIRDVRVMEELKGRLKNLPPDWSGDPCLPPENSWTGVSCSRGRTVRVVSLTLTNFGLSGSLPDSIANLTAVRSIWLGGNNLSGSIPDMSTLKHLVSLRLENNQFTGQIPHSLEKLERLQELFLENNKLHGELPSRLKSRRKINIRITPGNQIE